MGEEILDLWQQLNIGKDEQVQEVVAQGCTISESGCGVLILLMSMYWRFAKKKNCISVPPLCSGEAG